MVSIKDVKELHKKYDLDSKICPWRTRVARKVSTYTTWLFLQTPMTPNQITLLMYVFGFIAVFLFMFGNYFYSLLAILCMHLSFFIDHSDGEVARYRKKGSFRGYFLDLMSHTIINPLVIIGISVGAYFNNPTGIPKEIFLIFGFIGAYSLMINNFVKLKRYEVYINLKELGRLGKLRESAVEKEDAKKNIIKREILDFFKISIFDAVFLFGILNLLPYLVFIYGVLFPLQALKRMYSEFKNEKNIIKY